MRLRRIAAVAVASAALVGCSTGIQVDDFPVEPGTDLNCRGFYGDPAPSVAGQPLKEVSGRNALAWGDPPIIVRCGVERPAALTPTSRCDMVADIGWFTEKTVDGLLFTTIGRTFNISVEVPEEYQPAADALVDLAPRIARHDPEVTPCV